MRNSLATLHWPLWVSRMEVRGRGRVGGIGFFLFFFFVLFHPGLFCFIIVVADAALSINYENGLSLFQHCNKTRLKIPRDIDAMV